MVLVVVLVVAILGTSGPGVRLSLVALAYSATGAIGVAGFVLFSSGAVVATGDGVTLGGTICSIVVFRGESTRREDSISWSEM